MIFCLKTFYNILTDGKLFTLDLKTHVDIAKEICCLDSKKNFQSTPGELRYRAQGFVIDRRFGYIRRLTVSKKVKCVAQLRQQYGIFILLLQHASRANPVSASGLTPATFHGTNFLRESTIFGLRPTINFNIFPPYLKCQPSLGLRPLIGFYFILLHIFMKRHN